MKPVVDALVPPAAPPVVLWQSVCSLPNRGSAKPIFPRSSPWSHAAHSRLPPYPQLQMPYVTPFFRLPPPGRFDPAMHWANHAPTKDRHRGNHKCKCKTFLRLFDRIHRKVKEESDASFVLSLLYYLGAVHRKSTRVPLRTKGGSARETRFKLAFPPALPPNFRVSGLTELVWF